MKVKNIAFSGIMAAILMGASGANAAVEIASKQYVMNQVGDKATTAALESAQSTLQGAIDLKADKDAFETLQSAVNSETTGLATKASTTALTEGLADKVDLSVYNQHLNDQTARDEAQDTAIDALVGADGQGGSFAELTNKVETLTGGAEVTGSVANQIASALTDANDYTDEQITALTTGEGAVAKNAAAIAALETNKADASVVTALSNQVSALDDTYATDTELSSAKDTLQNAIDAKVATSDYNTKVGELETAIAGKQTELTATQLAAVNSGVTSDTVAQVTSNKTATETNANAITEINNSDVMKSGITAEKREAYDQAVSDLANKITKPAECESGDCVLAMLKGGEPQWVAITIPVGE